MAGFSNSVCRRICREYGADGAVSEFVYSRAVLCGAKRVLEKLSFCECERPVGIQIFGSDPAEVADAASLIEERLSPDFIDINFGCPAPNATAAGAGAALLKNPKSMCDIISKTAAALKKTPLTAKMRTGWDMSSIIVPDAAKALGRRRRANDNPSRTDKIEGIRRGSRLEADRGNGCCAFRPSDWQRFGGKTFRRIYAEFRLRGIYDRPCRLGKSVDIRTD